MYKLIRLVAGNCDKYCIPCNEFDNIKGTLSVPMLIVPSKSLISPNVTGPGVFRLFKISASTPGSANATIVVSGKAAMLAAAVILVDALLVVAELAAVLPADAVEVTVVVADVSVEGVPLEAVVNVAVTVPVAALEVALVAVEAVDDSAKLVAAVDNVAVACDVWVVGVVV